MASATSSIRNFRGQVFRARGEGVGVDGRRALGDEEAANSLEPYSSLRQSHTAQFVDTFRGGADFDKPGVAREKQSREAWGQSTPGQQGGWGTSRGRSSGRTRQHGWCSRCSSRCSSRYFSGHSPNYSQRRDAGLVGWRPLQAAHAALRSVGSARRLSRIVLLVARQSGGGAHTGRPEG